MVCGGYDGRISIWEISEKQSSNENGCSTTIFPQLRHVIDNSKVHKKADQQADSDEVLVLGAYEREAEAFILVGGNNRNI